MRKDNKSLVSIIIPCYNAEQTINRCLESVFAQTYEDTEIICVDDGSTDKTFEIIKDFQKSHSNIKVLQQENKYAGVARNLGIKNSSGEYLLFLDSDDYFFPTMVEKLIERANDTEADIVICNAYFYDCETGEYTLPDWVLNKNIMSKFNTFSYKDIPNKIFQASLPVPWNKLYKREFVASNGLEFQATKRVNDEYFTNIAMVCAKRISWIDDRLLIYMRNNGNSLQGFSGDEISSDFYNAHKKIKETLVEKKLYEVVKESYLYKLISACISQLEKQKTYYQYQAMYSLIKEDIVPKLIIENWELEDNSFIKSILESETVGEYIFNTQKKKNSINDICKIPFRSMDFDHRRIALYGAGYLGKEFYKKLVGNSFYTISGWYDKQFYEKQKEGLPVLSPDDIDASQFDYIVIAIENRDIAMKVKELLVERYNVPVESICTIN